MSRGQKGRWRMFIILAALIAFPLLWRSTVKWYYGRHIYSSAAVPPERVAIVFGAAIYGNSRLSSVLRDRMETAIHLYESGTVQKIIVSGDNSSATYNEPGAMMAYAIERGVPAEDVQPDYGGRRTYDTCYRAHHIFQVKSAVLVTQAFHLPRALFTCNTLGLKAIGVPSDLRPYRAARWYEMRETAATLVALWDVLKQQPPPVLGEPISIE